jgi:putative ABC transport system substrate-binding protein
LKITNDSGFTAQQSVTHWGEVMQIIVCLQLLIIVLWAGVAQAQQTKVYRVGVLLPGEAWYEIIDGLRVGLKELGLEEGKQYSLPIRDWRGDTKAGEEAAGNLEQEKVDLIYASSSGSAIAAKRATANTPIVFCAGTDPVVLGLAESFAKPGGRLTGVYYRDTELMAKRLEILKEIVPKLRRVVTFYNPRTRVALESSKLVREAAQQMGVQFIERHFASGEELQRAIRALRRGEADAFMAVADPEVDNQYQLIIETARLKRLPTMFVRQNFAIEGGLASYSVSFREVGRLSAKYVQRVLTGVAPNDLPLQGVDRIDLIINLKTAKQIGLTIPPTVLARADKVIK